MEGLDALMHFQEAGATCATEIHTVRCWTTFHVNEWSISALQNFRGARVSAMQMMTTGRMMAFETYLGLREA